MKKNRNVLLFINRAIYLCAAAMLLSGLVLTVAAQPVLAGGGNGGAIWTTRDDCGDKTQNVNHYNIGEVVYINGSGFDANETKAWTIKGQPGGASGDPGSQVAGGNKNTGASGTFCFAAYTVQADDWGEYKVKFGNKGDNYNVKKCPTVTPPTPTEPTPTDPTPTQPTPTDPTPTDPTPTDPTPTDPTPTDPTPTDPTPTDPTPTDPTPTDPTPTDPTPTETETVTPTETETETVTPTETETLTVTPTETETLTVTPTDTETVVPTEPTETEKPKPSKTPVPTLIAPEIAGGGLLIPVTGAHLNPGMHKLTFGGLGLFGLGLIFSAYRRKLEE